MSLISRIINPLLFTFKLTLKLKVLCKGKSKFRDHAITKFTFCLAGSVKFSVILFHCL